MPFKSQAQRRWMYANEPEMAKRWEKHTPKGKLPKRVSEAPRPEEGAPPGYKIDQLPTGIWRVITPGGNVQDHWTSLDKALMYAWWHYGISGEGGTDPERNWRNEGTEMNSIKEMFGVQVECDALPAVEVPEIPKMNEVFVVEAPIQNRPPPGSQPLKPTEFATMGQKGQALKKNLDAMKTAGQEMTPYKTPAGEEIAFPKDAAPGRGPVKADITKGVWTPMTGSAATGTPFSSQTPTTTMK